LHLVRDIGYEQSLREEIWRLTKDIELAGQKGLTLDANNLVRELEVKLADYTKLRKRKGKLASIG